VLASCVDQTGDPELGVEVSALGSADGSGSANHSTKWTSPTTLGNGWASDDGATWGVAGQYTINETTGATSIGATPVTTGEMASIVGTENQLVLESATRPNPGVLKIENNGETIWDMSPIGPDTTSPVQIRFGRRTQTSGGISLNLLLGNGTTTSQVSLNSNGPSTFRAGIKLLSHAIISDITTPPTMSACGSGTQITPGSHAFTVTTGAGATGCVITFSLAFNQQPTCIVTSQNGIPVAYSYTKTALTLAAGTAASSKYDVACWAH
jgi:hypothetical protein